MGKVRAHVFSSTCSFARFLCLHCSFSSLAPRQVLLYSVSLNSIISGSKCNVFLRFRRSNRTKLDQELVYYFWRVQKVRYSIYNIRTHLLIPNYCQFNHPKYWSVAWYQTCDLTLHRPAPHLFQVISSVSFACGHGRLADHLDKGEDGKEAERKERLPFSQIFFFPSPPRAAHTHFPHLY